MRALVIDPAVPGGLSLGEAADPMPSAHQVVVQIQAVSLNRGEVSGIPRAKPGTVLGWDAAGTVVQAAADGSGPDVGTRVVTLGGAGGWAERRAVGTTDLAVLPEGLDAGLASALPVAGVTALRAIRLCGGVVGRRILITGASGGVGRFGVQLAHRAGARVVALVGNTQRGAGLADLGADEVVTDIETGVAPVYGVLENVGGSTLVTAFRLLELGGTLVSIGAASGEPSSFPAYSTVGPHRSLISFTMNGEGGDPGADLGYLVNLLHTGELDPQVNWRGDWSRAGEAIRLLLGRQVAGKAVLDVV